MNNAQHLIGLLREKQWISDQITIKLTTNMDNKTQLCANLLFFSCLYCLIFWYFKIFN